MTFGDVSAKVVFVVAKVSDDNRFAEGRVVLGLPFLKSYHLLLSKADRFGLWKVDDEEQTNVLWQEVSELVS